MPDYQEDLDHITGVLVAKDLLDCAVRGELERPIGPLARRASFVPETMSIREFIRYSQRRHMHLSIVVDEHGGTEGLVTLDDAIEEVVGEIRDSAKRTGKRHKRLARGVYRIDGSMPLDELSRLLDIEIDSPAHETVSGFFMERLKRIPELGDQIDYNGVRLTVEAVEGKRATALRAELKQLHQEQPR
jgi:CBS domain containing-hemolysin-like protein